MRPGAPPASVRDLLVEYDTARDYSQDLVAGLDRDQIAWRPNADSSAIGWHLGHQAAVNHFMVRNLTAAEPTFNRAFDELFDSATPEPERGSLPAMEDILDYRASVAGATRRTVERILDGAVGAREQLMRIADGLLRSLINHEYQHDAWILEVRAGMTGAPAPVPASTRLEFVEGYWMIAS